VSDCYLTPTQQFFSQLYHGENTLLFNEMMAIRSAFVLDQHAWFDFNSASSLKQQSVYRDVASP